MEPNTGQGKIVKANFTDGGVTEFIPSPTSLKQF